jgi:DNA-binding LacI/PurR family transcriptional regulator
LENNIEIYIIIFNRLTGELMATINDIAKRIGISKATVSNVLTKKKTVSEELTQKVLEVCKQLNYQPNRIASSLVTKKIFIIGLMLENTNDSFKNFYGDLIRGVSVTASEYGYRVLLDVNTASGEYIQNSHISRSDPVDGSIILSPLLADARVDEMLKSNLPFIVIGKLTGEIKESVLSVDVDNIELVRTTTCYLLDKGHKRIGFLNSKPNLTITFERLKGYIKALNDHNINFEPELVYNTNHTKQSGFELCSRLLQEKPGITAVITCSDEVAAGVYKCVRDEGKRIPEDISVIALGGDDFINELKPKLITVQIDYSDIGREAVKLLMKKLNNQPIEKQQIIVMAKRTEGESCLR